MTIAGFEAKIDILVGIVTLNRKAKLIQTLDECRRQGFANVIVLDNGSTDGTREFLREQSHVTSIFTERNEGGSGGFNRIMRHFIQETEFAWLLTFDDDAYPAFSQEDLSGFLSAREGNHYPAYAFRVTYPDGSLCEMNCPGSNVLERHPLLSLRSEFHIDEFSGPTEVDFAGFVGLLLSRATIRQVGIVSKQFFIYSDDTYYTLCISKKCGKILYYPKFALIHDCKRSSRRFAHHDASRLERDVINKIVMIREHSRFKMTYLVLYVARSLFINPGLAVAILRASRKGLAADISLYRNQAI
jgi:GT2 family glycosyltransferase